MEKNVNFQFQLLEDEILTKLQIEKINPDNYSSLSLAFIGDAIYDVFARYYVMSFGDEMVSKFHKSKAELVNAQGQAKSIEEILPILSEKEISVYKRGRNTKSHTSAKNASIGDYRKATGFEALIGYTYLSGNFERLIELIALSLQGV